MLGGVEKELLVSYLEGLVDFGPRDTGSSNCAMAAHYLYNEFDKLWDGRCILFKFKLCIKSDSIWKVGAAVQWEV